LKSGPLVLAAPDFGAIDTLARRSKPAVLWAVGSQSLAGHWLDEAVRQGYKQVIIHSPDRPAQVRTELADGAFWSLALTVSPQPAPPEAVAMTALPGGEPRVLARNAAELLCWWLALNQEWLTRRQAGPVSIDHHQADGGWIGPHAQVDPACRLQPPYWIGARAIVGAGCVIGPGALIGTDCLLDQDIRVENSVVLAKTSLGPHLDLKGVIVSGPVLLDPTRGVRVDIVDRFIADALHRPRSRVAWSERLLAALLLLPAGLAALGRGPVTVEVVALPGDQTLRLLTGQRGNLLGRRAGWLRAVVGGHLRLVGPLPRPVQSADPLPAESRDLLATVIPGVFSLADVQGVHTTADPEEIAHALYQAAVPAADGAVRDRLFQLCLTRPGPAT
jgi:hypothetical protein